MCGGGDVFLLLPFFVLGFLDGDGVEGDLDLGGVVEEELHHNGDRMGGRGGRASPLKGYGLVALSWVLPPLYRLCGCPRVPPIPSYDVGKVLELF